jgi:DNA-binding beta-propeller fold protein YncE
MKKLVITIIIFSFLIHSLSFSQTNIRLSKLWEVDSVLMTPESVVFDSLRNCLYVSNFNDKGGFRSNTDTIFDECISRVDLEGNVTQLSWVDNLIGPAGIAIFEDTLYVIERGYLTKINIEKQSITERIPITGAGFLNDIAIDKNGDIYISNSGEGAIYKVAGGKSRLWLKDAVLQNCNGLYIDNGKLIVGNQGNENLIAILTADKSTNVLAKDISKGIDGIKKYKQYYIVSWQYDIFMVDERGASRVILNTSEGSDWNADFELIGNKDIIIVPTLLSNKLIAYKIYFE